MQTWETAFLTAIISILTAVITTKVTAWSSHKNEVRKWLLEKRTEVYFEFYEQAEILLQDTEILFDLEYYETLCKYKPKMKLLASCKTFIAFENYCGFVFEQKLDYDRFIEKNDPLNDMDRYHIVYNNSTGKCDEFLDISQFEIDNFKDSDRIYKQNNAPDIASVNKYLVPLYQAMRKDLGSDI